MKRLPMKLLIVWTGAVVPSYRHFLLELSRLARLRILSPSKWKHGSVTFQSGRLPEGPKEGDYNSCDIVPTIFFPEGSSRYIIPFLPLHLWRFRPSVLYIMDEMDRLNLAWHALLARICLPRIRIVIFCLQNMAHPSYYRWNHRLALALNRKLIHGAIAASPEVAEVLRNAGFRGPSTVIPIGCPESYFIPGDPSLVAKRRSELGIPSGSQVLLFSGSLCEAKGLRLLQHVLPRFPGIRLIAAGAGPLLEELQNALGNQFIYLGPLQGEEIVRFYQLGDYVILPSLTQSHWMEQVGRSLIEGILCGCLALGSDSGAIPRLTLFPETTFRQNDEEDLFRLMKALPLPQQETLRTLQRVSMMENFSASAVAEKTWNFIQSEIIPTVNLRKETCP